MSPGWCKWLNSFHYEVDKESGLINYNEVEILAKQHKPKLIIAGGSAYSRVIDFKKFHEIANKVNSYLMVDMAHFAGLVAGKGYPNPIEHADIVTSTTHKVLRGGRGGIILTNREDLIKKINSAVFPGYQGGPLMHIIAAKAVCFQEALQDSFKIYIRSVIKNAKILSETLQNNGFKIFSGGTDTHLMLVDLRPYNVTGKDAESSLERANITCNKNGISLLALLPLNKTPSGTITAARPPGFSNFKNRARKSSSVFFVFTIDNKFLAALSIFILPAKGGLANIRLNFSSSIEKSWLRESL